VPKKKGGQAENLSALVCKLHSRQAAGVLTPIDKHVRFNRHGCLANIERDVIRERPGVRRPSDRFARVPASAHPCLYVLAASLGHEQSSFLWYKWGTK
jgi:hypothetical protein